MITLTLSIFSSTIIFVIFKLFNRFNIDTFQAIVVNYFTAASIGIGLYSNSWDPIALEDASWIWYVILTSILFISMFLLMGYSSQLNGVASTSIAVKMSMAISLLMMIYGYKEDVSFLKVSGIVLAFIGVFLVSYTPKKDKLKSAWMLLILFIGGGLLDFTLNYVQNFKLGHLSTSLFSSFSFLCAGMMGLTYLIINLFSRKMKFDKRSVPAGIILGIPNFFSIYFLMLSYKTIDWSDSTVLAIINVSVVLLSAIIGFVAFKESKSTRKIIGLLSALLAIATLYIAQ